MAQLPAKVRLEVYDAIFAYAETGNHPQLSEQAEAAFGFIRTDMDLEADKAIAICEKRHENAMKRWNRTKDKE